MLSVILAEEVPHSCFLPAFLTGSRRPDMSSAKAVYLWKPNLPTEATRFTMQKYVDCEIDPILLSENTFEGHIFVSNCVCLLMK